MTLLLRDSAICTARSAVSTSAFAPFAAITSIAPHTAIRWNSSLILILHERHAARGAACPLLRIQYDRVARVSLRLGAGAENGSQSREQCPQDEVHADHGPGHLLARQAGERRRAENGHHQAPDGEGPEEV